MKKSILFATVMSLTSLSAHALTLPQGVYAIEKLLGEKGTVVRTESSKPAEMLREFACKTYGDDECKDIGIKLNQPNVDVDTSEVGSLRAEGAENALTDAVDYLFDNGEDSKQDIADKKDHARKIIAGLKDAGGVFGYDANAQSGCAAPEAVLLVLDTEGKKVTSFELAPCQE